MKSNRVNKNTTFLAVILVLSIISACTNKNDLKLSKTETSNIGKFHNQGLDFINSQMFNSSKFKVTHDYITYGKRIIPFEENTVPSKELINLAYDFVDENTTYPQIYDIEIQKDELVTELDFIREDISSNALQLIWSNNTSSACEIIDIPLTEKQAVSDLEKVFSDLGNQIYLSPYQQYDYIKKKIESLQSKYVLNESELFSGLLEIASSSNDYWYLSNQTTGNLPGIPINNPQTALVQIDCIGYIVGWAVAVNDDYRNGQLTPDRQWGRIRAGLIGAIGASSLGLIH